LPSLPEHGRRLRNSSRTEAFASLRLEHVLAETPSYSVSFGAIQGGRLIDGSARRVGRHCAFGY
jgi:hypothetical protein